MGQAASTTGFSWPDRRDSVNRRSTRKRDLAAAPMTATVPALAPAPSMAKGGADLGRSVEEGPRDYTSDLPDECLACIFHTLPSGDRKRCSLVCRRWLRVEGQSRHRLSLDARSDLAPFVPALFSRFDSVSKLALKCDRRAVSIDDDALVIVAVHCRNLTRLKLRACRELTDSGMEAFAMKCTTLKKVSCGSCTFGAKGIKALVDHCPALEELSVKRLRGLTDSNGDAIGAGSAATNLRSVCLKELYNGQCFVPMIAGAKKLQTLKLFRNSGEWDLPLQTIVSGAKGLTEIHLERLQVGDRGLEAVAKLEELEVLHLVKTPDCTNAGLIAVSEHCMLLRKLHIDGWKTNRIGDEGLIAIARKCQNLQELVLIGVNPTSLSLGILGNNCLNLERLALCGSDTVGDPELCCIAAKCASLKKLCIKGCPVTDQGLGALAGGCPNLVKVKVKKCRMVTAEGGEWLRTSRGTVSVNLDVGGGEENLDASTSDGGAGPAENGEQPVLAAPEMTPGSSQRGGGSKSRLGLFAGRSLIACTFRRWSGSHGNPSSGTKRS
ncbi:F-box protein [Nymphaea thermarum]|nr:F-box protein [Nymphaea thermarum]